MTDRAAVFTDGGYFDKVLGNAGGLRVDLEVLSEKVCGPTERLRTYYYHCYPRHGNPPTQQEQQRYSSMDRFFHQLRRLRRFEVRLGRLQFVDGAYQQKGVDTLLSIDLVELAATGQISKAILISGDSDFVPAVRRAKDRGVILDLYYSPATFVHDELFDACDERFVLDRKLLEGCLRTSTKA